MATFFDVAPTFFGEVDIPRAGATAQQIDFEFRHQRRSEFDALAARLRDESISIDDAVRAVVAGWKLPEREFSETALNELMDLHAGASMAIWVAYRRHLIEGKRKN